jgi:DNA-binding SARP family transcriptional activator
MFKLKLFGTGQAWYDDQSLPNFPSQQSYLLLCYLLLNSRHPHPRDQLATIFWGEYPTHISRKYLRNGLWRLRQVFEGVGAPFDEFLSVSDDSIAFISTSRTWLDVDVFDNTVSACQDTPGYRLSEEQAANLETAMELYNSDLLIGVYQDWCIYDRERLSLLYLNSLSKLMIYYEGNGAYERGLACGERILARDNTREKVHLQMMRLYWHMGDRNAALAQYKRCAQILRDEIGISPLKETSSVYLQMINNRFNPEGILHGKQDSPLGGRNAGDEESKGSPGQQALHKLQYLHEVIEEASRELRYLENLIQTALLGSKE